MKKILYTALILILVIAYIDLINCVKKINEYTSRYTNIKIQKLKSKH